MYRSIDRLFSGCGWASPTAAIASRRAGRARQGRALRELAGAARLARSGRADARRCGRWPPAFRRAARDRRRTSPASSRFGSNCSPGMPRASRRRTMHRALARNHGYARQRARGVPLPRAARASRTPQATVMLDFAVARECAGRFRPGAGDHRSAQRRSVIKTLDLRDDAGLEPASVRRDRAQPEGRDLACLSSPRLRVVQRRARSRCGSTTPSAPSPAPAITSPRCSAPMASSLWATRFRIDPCPVRGPQKKGRVESGVKYRQVRLRAAARVSQPGARQRATARVDPGRGRQSHPRQHPRAPADAVHRDRAGAAAAAAGHRAGVPGVGQGQAARQLPRPVRVLLLLGAVSR